MRHPNHDLPFLAAVKQPLTPPCFLADELAFECRFLGRLGANDFGAEGAKAIGEALAANKNLTSLGYATLMPLPYTRSPLLHCVSSR